MRYHNNKDDMMKKRKTDMEALKEAINKITDEIEKE
jgi:hypothetical protein